MSVKKKAIDYFLGSVFKLSMTATAAAAMTSSEHAASTAILRMVLSLIFFTAFVSFHIS